MSDKSNNLSGTNEFLLAKLLESCKKSRIKDIAANYNVRLSEKYTKQQMIDTVLPVIEVNFGVRLKRYSVNELNICMECFTEKEITGESAERIMNSTPFADGAVFITGSKSKLFARIPHELAGMIMMRCVANCFHSGESELERCAIASAAIYGSFTPKMLADVVNSAYAHEITERQAEEFLMSSSSEAFTYADGKAVCKRLPSTEFHPLVSGMDYCIPTRSEIESYAAYGANSGDYYFRQIVNFIYNNPDISYDRAASLIREIADWCRSDSGISAIFHIIAQSLASLSTDKYNYLLGMAGELYNRTRKPSLKGHRPEDIEGFKPIAIPDVQVTASKNEPVRTEQKIGRNAPCPCGSGKKYKKCCGKNKQ